MTEDRGRIANAALAQFLSSVVCPPSSESPPPLTPPRHSLREWGEGNREVCAYVATGKSCAWCTHHAGSVTLTRRYRLTCSASSTTAGSYSGASSICSRSLSPQYL